MSSVKVKPLRMLSLLAALLATLSVARGGHELPVYPSYYPHEIAIETGAATRTRQSASGFVES